MAGPINLEVLDAPIIEQTNFGPDMDRWITNVVDIINASFMTINNIFANVLAISSKDIGSGGAGPIAVSVPGLTPSGSVTVNLLSSSNPASIMTVTIGTNQFTVTFNVDPGASAIIQYIAFTAAPQ